jgi:predicted nucleic acid-binding protein
VIFVDTNVVMYAVGRAHPLRGTARGFFEQNLGTERNDLVTDAEVLHELLHAYIPVSRLETLDAALTLVDSCISRVLPIEAEDVHSARLVADSYPQLGARDLLHLAVCRRYSIPEVMTFDRALAAVFAG